MKWPAKPKPDMEKPAYALACFGAAAPPSSPQLAKAGGSPRCCPVLCGLRDRCIAAMLATLVPVRTDRDTKAELNRRSQACEGPDRHRCSRRANGQGDGCRPHLILLPKQAHLAVGRHLLGYALINSPAH
jgi:hypothetical protein